MFQWAQSTLDKLAQHVAPPPEDGPGRFAYCLQRGDENAAMGCIAAMDPVHTIINQVKGQYPIHLACQYSCQRLLELLLNQPGMNIQQTDLAGNTPLHYASMSTAPNGLDVIKLLITNYGASVVARNAQGQTPYDVATLNVIRQYLLPIQLQAETQIALDNGGQGLPPGIDLGGLKINSTTIAPPPTFAAGPPGSTMTTATTVQSPNMPANAPSPSQTTQVTPAPSSREYSRVGSSSAALGGKYRADGFHSSSSDVSLQKKYGHANVGSYSNIAPPPSSGNSVGVSPASGGLGVGGGGGGGGANPFAAGGRYANRRYVAYGQVATSTYSYSGSTMSAPSSFGASAPTVSFTPSSSTAMTSTTSTTTTPSSYGAPMATTPYMPPPPYQSQNLGTANSLYSQNPMEVAPQYPRPVDTPGLVNHNHTPNPSPWPTSPQASDTNTTPTMAVQNSANLAEASAQDVFTAPSPQKEVPAATTTLEPSQEQITNHVVTESTPTAANDAYAPSSSTSLAAPLLPEHWVEAVDPSSGQTYYYNTVTNETSWETPTALPENWVEATDPTSGQVYYYNHVTQETSWDKPMVPAAPTELSTSSPEHTVPTESEGAMPLAGEMFGSTAPTGTQPPTDNHTSGADASATEAAFTVSAADTFSSAPVPASSPTKGSTANTAFVSPEEAFNSAAPPAASVVDTSVAINAFNFPAPPSVVESAVTSAIAASSEDNAVPGPGHVVGPMPSTTNPTFNASPPPMSSLHVSPPRRTISADELFAEDPPQDDDDNNNNPDNNISASSPPAEAAALSTPQKPTLDPNLMDEFDGDGTLDDIPLSPDLQRPVVAEAVAPMSFPTTTTTTTTTTMPMDTTAESLFAAIGMPPPPFSARKR